jgi:hypothetical protein
MAITVISQPADVHAAYNPIKFTLQSDNAALPGFRYIIQIFDAGTSNLLVDYKAAPDPTLPSGQTQFDISRIIQNKVDKFLTFESNAVNLSTGAYYEYDIKFGESRNSDWAYQDYVFHTVPGGNTALTSDSALIGTGTDIPHGYITSDQIFLSRSAPYGDDRDLIDGYFIVLSAISTTTVAIDLSGIVDSGGAATGDTRYSDYQKLITLDIASVTSLTAVNAAQDVVEYALESGSLDEYVLSGASSQFLTDLGGNFYATELQSLFVNMLQLTEPSGELLYFENDGGDILSKANAGVFPVYSNSIGPGNLGALSLVSGTTNLIKDDTLYYDVYVMDGATQKSEKLRVNIDRRCKINTTEILFMDRKGSFMSFAFQNRGFESINADRQTYRKYVADYKTSSEGESTYHSKYTKILNLNTNFMNEDMNVYYEQLFTSRHTYIKYDGIWYACTAKDTSLNNEYELNNKNIKKNLSVTFDLVSPIN